MINIASVGFWHLHGADYAGAAQRHPEVDLVAGWDPDPERLRAAGNGSDCEPWTISTRSWPTPRWTG